MADPADAKEYARPRVEAAGFDWPTYEKQIQQESGWAHWSAPGVVKTSYSGAAKGLGQLHKDYYPAEVWSDPYRNIDASIDTMAKNLARFGSYRKALAAYNWGGGNVGGYTDGAGRVHPAWDGTREWRCPHEAAVAQCRTAQRDHYLDVVLGPGWPEPADNTGSADVVYDDYRDPEPAGRFASQPKGVILHGSRSGRPGNPKRAEYEGTARYEQTNPGGLGWHATLGMNRVALHLTPQEWGWHAMQASRVYLGVEFAQATVDEPITDEQVAAFCAWFERHVRPVWPGLPLHLPSHAEADREFGVNQGKSDVYPLGSPRMDELRARIMARLGRAEPAPAPPPVAAPPPDPRDALIADLKRQLDEERTKLGVLQAQYLPTLVDVVKAIGELKSGT